MHFILEIRSFTINRSFTKICLLSYQYVFYHICDSAKNKLIHAYENDFTLTMSKPKETGENHSSFGDTDISNLREQHQQGKTGDICLNMLKSVKIC